MTQNWRDWCRFCGSSTLTIKYECSVNVKYTFEISETIIKICEPCKLYITEFEDFLEKSKRVNQLFHELASTICSNPDLNHLREKYHLKTLIFNDWKFEDDDDDNRLDVKDEFEVNDLELESVLKENLSAQFISELTEPQLKHKAENSEKSRKIVKTKSNKTEKLKKDDNSTESKRSNINASTFLLNMICHVCQEKFELFHSIQNHCRKVHNCKPEVMCICGQTIRRYGTYIDHKKKHMGDHVLYLCDHCPRKYYNKPRFIEHLLKHGFNGTQSFICSTCGKESISARNLKLHQLRHLPKEEKSNHSCPYCGKKFSRGNNLKNHINYVHASDPRKDYVCDQCGASFRLKGQLKSHKITHVDKRTVPCPICRLAFKNKSQVNCHMRIHGPKLFKCEICLGDYRTKYQLTKHMVCHTNEKEYKCPHCPNAYKRKKDLKCHLCVHTGERPYACPFCDRTFVNNSNCRKHKLQSHPQELAAYEAEQNKTRKIL